MTTSTPPENIVLALSPPKINGQTEPVAGAMVGLSKAAYELVADGEGAVVIVDPPLSGTTHPGDVIELWLKDDEAVLDSETISDPSAKTILRLPKDRLHSDRVNEVLYTIKRGSSNIGTSPPLTVLYNFIRLGLKDRLTVPGGHSELKLLLPDAIKSGVGPDFVSAEVCVSHPYGRAYDRIDLKCNGELMKAFVGKDQAPQPPDPGSEEPITFCFIVGRAFLDRAKRLDQKLNFSYTGTDQIGNGTDPDASWSPVQTVDEDLDGTRLPKAILLEQMVDYPGDDAEKIELEKLAGKPLLLVVLTIDPRFVVGYEVNATYTAKNTGQPADVVVPVSGKVEADPFGQKKPCILEVPNNKIFADSNVIVTYELRKPNGDLVGTSIPATATVTGSAPIALMPPTLVAPATNPIDVLSYENGVTVRIEHLAALPNDQARLLEVDPPPDAKPFLPTAFNQNKRANFKLSPEFLVSRRGTSTKLRWELIREGKPVGESKNLTLIISPIAENDPRFPPLNIAGETGGVLDVRKLDEGAQILSDKWPLQKAGQPTWITLNGTDKQGNSISKDVRKGEPNPSANGMSASAPVEWLNELKHDSKLMIEGAVSLDGSADKEKAVLLALRTYTVAGKRGPVTIDYWGPEGDLPNGTVRDLGHATLTVKFITGNPTAYASVLLTHSQVTLSNGAYTGPTYGTPSVVLHLKGESARTITVIGSQHLGNADDSNKPPPHGTILSEITFFDIDGKDIHRHQVPYSPNAAHLIQLTIPNGKSFYSFSFLQKQAPVRHSAFCELYRIIYDDQ
ncbi:MULTISPECIES: hypothetical protein [unclassified Pseudomonas]|uniref:hypothetical protein n=1 Tax=unclassified Pseudomonas TaxID=196821 RepID=UPI000A1D7E24|nr:MULTISPECIES: hypothetical protein [unclassified Pseudomonas]